MAGNHPDRALIARIAAHTRWANETDRSAATAAARRAAEDRWLRKARELHPDADDQALAEVAAHLRSAHYVRMALASAKARRAKRKTAPSAAELQAKHAQIVAEARQQLQAG